MSFRTTLMAVCDRAYARQSALDNPVLRLVRGQLAKEEAVAFWAPRWNNVLLLSQYTLPRLLESCPDYDARAQIWTAIFPEYGAEQPADCHAILFRDFLEALGVDRSRCPLSLPVVRDDDGNNDVTINARIDEINNRSWLESLGHFLGRETVGPRVFERIATCLREQYGLSDRDVRFFSDHAAQDELDSETVFTLAERYCTTKVEQEELLRGLDSYFRFETSYCCDLSEASVLSVSSSSSSRSVSASPLAGAA